MSLAWAGAPLEPGREVAREWARQELSDPAYQEARPGLLRRAVGWLLEQLSQIELRPGALTQPRTAAVLLVLLAVIAVVVWRLRASRLRSPKRDRRDPAMFDDEVLTAAEFRERADRAAREGRWTQAVQDRFRAVVRGLDERALLDDRPGRTADEAAAEAARVLPALGPQLTAAARLFDDVSYGDRAGTAEHDARLRALDADVTAAAASGAVRPGAGVGGGR